MFTENEEPLQLSHKRSERYRERHRGPRPLQSLTPNQLPPLVILRAEEYRRQHPERTFVSHKRKHTADFAVQVDREDTRIYDENYTSKIPRIDKTDGKSITNDLTTKEQHMRRPSSASIRSQGSRHTLLPASGSSQQQPQSPPPTPPRPHESLQQQRPSTPSPPLRSPQQQLQAKQPSNHVVPHKRKHTTGFAVYVDKEDTHIHDGNDDNKTPLIDKKDGVSITENLATKEQGSPSPPQLQSPQQQSQSPPPSQSPQAPITDNLATKQLESSSSPPARSPQQQSQSPPPPPSQSPQALITDNLPTKEPESSSPPSSKLPQQQSQSPPPPPQSSQVLITEDLVTKEPQQQPQSNKSDNHRDTASEMGGIPDDVDFEIDFDFGDMGGSMHDEQEDRPIETINRRESRAHDLTNNGEQEDRPVSKINRRDSTPVQSKARASAHDDEDGDRAIERTHPVHKEDKATSDEPDVDQHEILERVIERLADQKVLLLNPDTIRSTEMIKDKLHDAMLGTTVRITQQKALAQLNFVDQVLEMIQIAVANATSIQDEMLQAYLEMFQNYVVGPLGDHIRNMKDQKKSETRLRRIRHQKNAVRVKMLSEQKQANKIRQEVKQLEDMRKKIQKEQESYMELKDFLNALDNMS